MEMSQLLLFRVGYRRVLPCWRAGQGSGPKYLVSSRPASRVVLDSSVAKIVSVSFDEYLKAGLQAYQRDKSVQATAINKMESSGERRVFRSINQSSNRGLFAALMAKRLSTRSALDNCIMCVERDLSASTFGVKLELSPLPSGRKFLRSSEHPIRRWHG
jgi:hypothetical protein